MHSAANVASEEEDQVRLTRSKPKEATGMFHKQVDAQVQPRVKVNTFLHLPICRGP